MNIERLSICHWVIATTRWDLIEINTLNTLRDIGKDYKENPWSYWEKEYFEKRRTK